VLTYTSASPCGMPGEFERVTIKLYCGADRANGGPELIAYDKSSCTHRFEWHTPMACQVQCVFVSKSRRPSDVITR
jgi:hypothetical protein